MEVIDENDTKKLEELKTNNYLQDEVINISKSIAPWIPYIGVILAGISIGKYAYTRYLRHREAQKVSEASAKETQNKSEEYGVDEVERGVEPEKQ